MLADKYDVAICGAGLAGLMLAAKLAVDEKLNIAVIEARSLPESTGSLEENINSYDARVSALTAASQKLFESLGLWQKISRKQAYSSMTVWDAEGTGEIQFDAASVNQSRLGHIVENSLMMVELIEYLRYRKNVSLLDNSPVSSMYCAESQANLVFENGSELQAGLLVGADGANSLVRQQAGFRTREWDYGHHAIVCTVETELPHLQTAWQRFLPSGPLAFLPLAGGDGHFCSIVWSLDEEVACQLMKEEDAVFLDKLSFAFENRLGRVLGCSRRFSFPLRQRHSTDYVMPHIALVGDAAHTIHPLAGQGINLGFQDVAVLAEELQRAFRKNIPLGDLSVLQRYQRRRKPDNLAMMAVMEGFKRLFARGDLPSRLLRNFGMTEIGKHDVIKRRIIKAAMGLDGKHLNEKGFSEKKPNKKGIVENPEEKSHQEKDIDERL